MINLPYYYSRVKAKHAALGKWVMAGILRAVIEWEDHGFYAQWRELKGANRKGSG